MVGLLPQTLVLTRPVVIFRSSNCSNRLICTDGRTSFSGSGASCNRGFEVFNAPTFANFFLRNVDAHAPATSARDCRARAALRAQTDLLTGGQADETQNKRTDTQTVYSERRRTGRRFIK